MADGNSAIVADLGANLVCVLVILLAVTAVQSRPTPTDHTRIIPAHQVSPLSGTGQSDLLYLRLRPDPSILTVEVTADGAFASGAKGLVPLTTLPVPPPRRVVAYVFAPGPYAALRRLTDAAGLPVDDITVPEALRRLSPTPGQSAFSPAFLSLTVTGDPASIRPALLRLLTQGGTGGALAQGETGGGGSGLWVLFRQAASLAGLALALAFLHLLRRRWRS